MNKSIIAGLLIGVLAVGMSGLAKADVVSFKAPLDQHGNPMSASYAGYKSSHTAIAGEIIVCSGRCLLAGISMSTGANATFLRIKDTAIVGSALTSNMLVPTIRFETDSSAYNKKIPVPVRADNGITVQLSGIGTLEEVSIYYVPLTQ